LSKDFDTAQKVGIAMQEGFAKVGIDSDCYVSGINQAGPVVIG
jgi:homoserine kinase